MAAASRLLKVEIAGGAAGPPPPAMAVTLATGGQAADAVPTQDLIAGMMVEMGLRVRRAQRGPLGIWA